MGLRFRRRRSGAGSLSGVLGAEAKAIGKVLRRASNGAGASEEGFELEPLVRELFDEAPTDDIRALKDRGVEAGAFFETELRPNWEDRPRGERSEKVQSFVRLANVVGTDDPMGLGAVVRTKVVVLAWAYDRVYEQDLLGRLARTPQSFGSLDRPADVAT